MRSTGLRAGSSPFAATRWTLIVRARGATPEARAALSDLCAAYDAPVEAFICSKKGDADVARELTQEFFSRVLSGTGFGGAMQSRGRFRSYLLGAVKHFLAAEGVRRSAVKRGGGAEHLPLENSSMETEAGLQVADASSEPADVLFDRRWATTLLGRALDRLESELASEGKGRVFDALKVSLLGKGDSVPYAEVARRLGMSEAAIKVLVHRLRKRFRGTLKSEIAETLNDPARVEEEMRALFAALG